LVGRVMLWGEVVEGEHGWRNTRAYPKHLNVPRVASADDPRVQKTVAGLEVYG
jgi:hypothetical protein